MAKICKNKVEQVLNIIVGDNVVTVLDNANLVCIKVTIWIMEKLFFLSSPHRHAMVEIQDTGIVMSPLYFILTSSFYFDICTFMLTLQ